MLTKGCHYLDLTLCQTFKLSVMLYMFKPITELKCRKTKNVFKTLMEYWLQQRRHTRKHIAAFPEKQLFAYTIGKIPSFGDMALEQAFISGPGIRQLATGIDDTLNVNRQKYRSKNTLLGLWDHSTVQIEYYAAEIDTNAGNGNIRLQHQLFASLDDALWYFLKQETALSCYGNTYLNVMEVSPPLP